MVYFCVSDIHSHYDELLIALKKASFDVDNSDHMLVVLGDLFDRGDQTIEVLGYMYDLYNKEKAIFILGNHDLFLLDFLNRKFERTVFNFERNGHQKTIEQLLKREISKEDDFDMLASELEEMYPYLKEFLSSFQLFYELDEYFLVHGGVNAEKEDYKDDEVRTFVWTRMIDAPRLKDRVMIVGHTPAFYVRSKREDMDHDVIMKNPEMYQDYYDVFDEGDLIHIDGGVYSGGRINVLKIIK